MEACMAKTLLIVYHSRTGGTRQMAEALQAGARGCGTAVAVRLLPAADAGPADLLAADAYVFACPENLAAVSGVMKDFFDRSYYGVLDRINGRAFALLVCAGSDGRNAVRQMERIATGWRLKAAAAPLIVCTGAQTPEAILAPKTLAPEALADCRALGEALATGLEMGIF
ncbi:MAG: NAD(P)H-dependent oxidoreductase [Comamonadaceae bacterium]|nr:NAD(P)H-dependent oxidoreductase [Comamonadaceae bacterium]